MAVSRSSVSKQVTKPPDKRKKKKKKKAKLGSGKRFKEVSKAIQRSGKSEEAANAIGEDLTNDPEKITRSPRVFRDSQTRDTARQANYAGEHHRKKAAQSKHDQVIGLAKKLGSLKTQRGGGIVGKNKIIKGYKKGGKI